jgi:hypothetical protein
MAIDQAASRVGDQSEIPPGQGPKVHLPGLIEVAKQASHDLFNTKDVQDTPTVSYAWMADQFGHFALGFEITYLLSWFALYLGWRDPRVFVGLAVAVVFVFVVKELIDYFSKRQQAIDANSIFKFNRGEILFNVWTAQAYISFGAGVAGAALARPTLGIIALLLGTPFALALGFWWLRRKITFQQAGLPYLYRLANFPNEIDRETAEYIVEMTKPGPSSAASPIGRHLIITGVQKSGKSSLAIAIGTEFAFRMGIGLYTSLVQLLRSAMPDEDGRPGDPDFDTGRILWPWDQSDMLIIDDVDVVSDVIERSKLDATAERQALEVRIDTLIAVTSRTNPEFLKTLKERRTVWVLCDADNPTLAKWQTKIAGIMGTGPADIRTLRLEISIKKALHVRPTLSPEAKVVQ